MSGRYHPSTILSVVGNGVDLSYFQLLPAAMLLFVGVLNYWTNVAGICWFVRYVWPSVRR